MLFWHLGMTVAIVFLTLGRRSIDFRVVMLGGILPDLIDKPIGTLIFEERFRSGRIYGHTLLFCLLLLLCIQMFLRGRTARRWFVLPIGCLIHLALDGMWNEPITLFWPLFGAEFPETIGENYWYMVLLRPFQHPIYALQEMLGLALLGYFASAFRLHEKDRLRAFFKTGTLTDRPASLRGSLEE